MTLPILRQYSKFPYLIISMSQNMSGQCFHMKNHLNQFINVNIFPFKLLFI